MINNCHPSLVHYHVSMNCIICSNFLLISGLILVFATAPAFCWCQELQYITFSLRLFLHNYRTMIVIYLRDRVVLRDLRLPSNNRAELQSAVNHSDLLLTHWGRDKMADIFQTTFSNAFSWMKMLEFWLKCHWSLFLRVQLTIIQHWFR